MNRYPKKERCRVVERKLKREGKANQTPLVSIISTEKREKEEKSLFLCRTETRRAGRSLCCPHFTLCPMRKRIIHILSSSFRRATNRDRREILNETRREIEREKGREEGNERAKQTNGIRLDGGGQRWADRGGAGRGKWWICFTFHGGAIVPYYPAWLVDDAGKLPRGVPIIPRHNSLIRELRESRPRMLRRPSSCNVPCVPPFFPFFFPLPLHPYTLYNKRAHVASIYEASFSAMDTGIGRRPAVKFILLTWAATMIAASFSVFPRPICIIVQGLAFIRLETRICFTE